MPTNNSAPAKRGRPAKPENVQADSVAEAGTEIIKKKPRGGNSPMIGDNGMLVKGDEKQKLTARLLNEALSTYKMPRVTSDEELSQRISDYFTKCAQTGEKPTVEQLALCTGYSYQTLWDWENGINHGFSPNTSEIIKKAKSFLRVFDAKLVMEGALNPVTYIFRAKNYYGMKDQQEYVLTPNQPLGADADASTMAQKYKNALPSATIAGDFIKD